MSGSPAYLSDWYVAVPLAVAILLAVLLWASVEALLYAISCWRNRQPPVEHLEDLRDTEADQADTAPEHVVQQIEREAFRSLDHLVTPPAIVTVERAPNRTRLTTNDQIEMITARIQKHASASTLAAELQAAASIELDMVDYQLGQILSEIEPLMSAINWTPDTDDTTVATPEANQQEMARVA